MLKTLIRKTCLTSVIVAALSFVGFPALAEETEDAPVPATEHQSETMKEDKGGQRAEGKTKKGATGEKGKKDEMPPATEHQEEALKGVEESDDNSRQMREEPAAPR